jgi:hypothetical protein
MDQLLTIILACSLHADDNLVRALASKLSVGNQFFVGNLSTLDTYDGARSVAEARAIADRIAALGGRPAVGYMAVPLEWAARHGRITDDLFDGCTNVAIATAMLSGFERACAQARAPRRSRRARIIVHATLPKPAVRRCILRRLEIELDITGVVEHVLPEAAKLDNRPVDPDTDAEPARSTVFFEDRVMQVPRSLP